jgi:hypothetical protein
MSRCRVDQKYLVLSITRGGMSEKINGCFTAVKTGTRNPVGPGYAV